MADHAYVGSRTPRLEDARLLAGRGRYVGNVRLPGMAYAVVVRSPIAHGRLTGCDTKAARAADGVLDVITVADAAGMRLPCAGVTPGGMKGAGEAGTISPPAAIGNAVAAALPEIADRGHEHAADAGDGVDAAAGMMSAAAIP
ncbi:hypothetical protein [Nonomuraea sp. LPB2021202275-12-8]|uniref:hypothetical protein n=1 Tax=Nonomuraea sp. LPB2021202275-12-8 TaxID=3120159 RepID=UPI00300C697F